MGSRIFEKKSTIRDSRHKVLYICVGFWLLSHLTSHLSHAEKKIGVVISLANVQNCESCHSGAPVAFKTWCGHQYRVGIICPPWSR